MNMLKAYAALVGSIATALLGIYGPDSEVGKVLTVIAAVATAVTVWAVPNLDREAEHQSVMPPRNEGGWVVLPLLPNFATFARRLNEADLRKRIGNPFEDAEDA